MEGQAVIIPHHQKLTPSSYLQMLAKNAKE
jgi:hypothetical protein